MSTTETVTPSPVRRRWLRAALVGAVGLGTIALSSDAPWAQATTRTTITFTEHVQYTRFVSGDNTGFNLRNNAFLISADGAYRVETFWHGNDGHFHTVDPQLAVYNETWTDQEENHNDSGSFGVQSLQGVRITRVDGKPFSLVGMDLHGGVSVGSFVTTGPPNPDDPLSGTWRLYTGDLTSTGNFKVNLLQRRTIYFANRYAGVTEIFLADPAAGAGIGTVFEHNGWDNIVLEAAQ
ncbi:MAG: hypothetical protein U0Q12_03995 [Vicinamibacterales bacterium]